MLLEIIFENVTGTLAIRIRSIFIEHVELDTGPKVSGPLVQGLFFGIYPKPSSLMRMYTAVLKKNDQIF